MLGEYVAGIQINRGKKRTVFYSQVQCLQINFQNWKIGIFTRDSCHTFHVALQLKSQNWLLLIVVSLLKWLVYQCSRGKNGIARITPFWSTTIIITLLIFFNADQTKKIRLHPFKAYSQGTNSDNVEDLFV